MARGKLFSSTLSEHIDIIENPSLADSLSMLADSSGSYFKVFNWDKSHVAVRTKIRVDIPPLGVYENLPILPVEPVLFVFDKKEYPRIAPKVYPDRLQFPKDKVPHLYVANENRPPGFCLVKGDIDEWYANKKIGDLVIRVHNWFRDAVTGDLAEDGNQFEPLRLEGYRGTIVYDYDQVAEIANSKKSFHVNSNLAIGRFTRYTTLGSRHFRLDKILSAENAITVFEDTLNELKKDQEQDTTKKYHFGYFVWSQSDASFSDYSVNLPREWESFKLFCERYEVDWRALETEVAKELNCYVSVPVILAIRRPKQIIGFSSNIEFINFYLTVDSSDIREGKIINNIPVAFQKHNQPLTTKRAQKIAGDRSYLAGVHLVFGVGALGSKIVTHFARGGQTNYVLIDPDSMSPHNLVRHALLAESIGLNKADGLTKAIKNIFPYEELTMLSVKKKLNDVIENNELTGFGWIFDFTASEAFFNSLIIAKNIKGPRICRASISDQGNLGIAYFEGTDRNPRIDDLQAILYSKYDELPFVKEWLQSDIRMREEDKLLVRVGIGCNSETMVLSDEKVSSHAAYFAGAIKHESVKTPDDSGKTVLSLLESSNDYSIRTVNISVPPMIVLQAVNDPSWEIRIKAGIVETMKREMGLAMPNETGGVFIGRANYKTKTIHVTDLIVAPPDSASNPVCFSRGIKGLPEQIRAVNEGTGGQLGYIGEWHSHPFGPNALSNTDHKTARRFKKELNTLVNPLPVFLTIITPEYIIPHVF